MPLRSFALGALLLVACSGDDDPKTGDSTPSTETGTPTTPTTPTETGDTATPTTAPKGETGHWTWVNPLPQGAPLHEIRFLTDTTVVALTEGGGFLRSTDAGETWANLYGIQDQAYAVFDAMSFVDDQRGWLVGNRGAVLYTADGGATWDDRSAPGFTFDLNDVFFTNADHGVAVGATGKILETDDGGLKWQERSHPLGSRFLHAVAFVDDLTGFAGGDDGGVLATTDGGTTWEIVPTTFDDDIVHASPAGDGVAFATRDAVRVYNGTSWSVPVSADGGVVDLRFDSPTDGKVLYSDAGELRLGELVSGVLSYDAIELELGANAFDQRGDRVVIGGFWGAMYVSDDGGTTFDDKSTRQLPTSAQLLDVSLAGDRGVAVGFDGLAMFSDDGGVTWDVAPTNTAADLRSCWVDAQGRAVAAGYETKPKGRVPEILWSTDSGETWAKATLPVDLAVIDGVALWDDGRGIAVGFTPPNIELALISEDGGQTWTARATPGDTFGFIEVWTDGTDKAWIGAGFGDLVRTLDGGATFATIDTKTSRSTHELQFVDGMTGFAATMSQDLLKTTDGGDKWQAIQTPASFDDVHFATPTVGLAVAGNGSVYGTNDGGLSWTRQPAGWSNFGQTRAVWMSSETDAVVVGSEAKIQYTRTAGGL